VQNIVIKYNVDKSEVDKSNASIQQAKNLTDQLKKSTQDLGAQSTKSGQDQVKAIGYVKQEMQRLKAQIDVTSRADTKRLNDLVKQYQAAKKQVDEFNKSLKQQHQATTQVVSGNNNVAASFMSMYSAMKLVISAAIIREFVDTSLEAARLSGNIKSVGIAFQRQIPNAELVLHNLQKATHNTVGELELMQRALRFQNFGGDVQKLPELLEFAAIRAQQTGESIDYMVNSIVDGIGRKSYLKLDNLGISLTRLKDQFNGVALNSLTVAEVTQGVAAIVKEETAKMGGYAETTATKVDQIAVSWENLKKSLADSAASESLLNFYDVVLKGADIFVRSFNKKVNAKTLFNTETGEKQALDEFAKLQEKINAEREKGNDIIATETAANEKRIEFNKREIDGWREKISTLNAVNDSERKQMESGLQAITFYETQNAKLAKTNELLKEYSENLAKANAAEKQDPLGLIPDLENKIDALEELINGSTEGGNRTGGARTKAELAKLNAELEIMKSKLSDLKRLGTGLLWDPERKVWIDIEKIWKNIKKIDTQTVKDASKDFAELAKTTGDVEKRINDLVNNPLPTSGGQIPRAEFLKAQLKAAFQDFEEEFATGGIDIAANVGQSILDIELMNQEQRLNNLKNFYDNQQTLAGDNERYKAELRVKEERETKKVQRELAISQRRARLHSIAIDTAASIAKAWVNPGWPGAVPLSAFLLAQGAAQAAIVSRTPLGFKDGVIDLKGKGTATSDSIPANLSRGESVMTAKETIMSKGILTAIRAKTLDDAKLARIVGMGRGPVERSSDNKNLEKYLREISKNTTGSNFTQNSGVVFEAKHEGNLIKRYNRTKFL
jgi:hypothetical protein